MPANPLPAGVFGVRTSARRGYRPSGTAARAKTFDI
jgi:hypothetical protein